jgi:hypothetical protein
VILLQALGDTTTLISIIVINIGAPLLVFSPKLQKNTPQFFSLSQSSRSALEKKEDGAARAPKLEPGRSV